MQKRTTITIEIPPTIKRRLSTVARTHEVKVSVVVRWAISRYLEAQSQKAA